MSVKGTSTLWRACVLGAANGLFAGSVAQTVLWLHEEYQRSHRPTFSDMVIDYADPLPWWVLPALGFVAFIPASVLVHRYMARRVRSVMLLWQYVGLVGVFCGVLVTLIFTVIDNAHGADPPWDYREFISLSYLWIYLMALAFAAVINLLYGAFIQSAVTHYTQRNKVEFP